MLYFSNNENEPGDTVYFQSSWRLKLCHRDGSAVVLLGNIFLILKKDQE